MKLIKLSPPHISGNEDHYIRNAINSGEVSNYGDNLIAFQNQLEEYLSNNSKVALLNSGTAAIHLALVLLEVRPGDEVICQSFTFAASANPICYLGAKPVFVDSELDTFNMCPILLEQAIKDRISKGKTPKAIILVHCYGMPAKVDEISAIASKYKISLIEDAAEALGSTYKGQKCGTFSDFGILSFNGNKMITTSGGGALICKSSAIRQKANFLSTQSKDNEPYYHHTEIGYNYKMSNIAAAIGRAQMESITSYVDLRRNNNNFYFDFLEEVKGIWVLKEPNNDFFSNHWLTVILIDEEVTGFSPKQLREELLKHQIETKFLWKPMHMQPVFEQYPYYGKTNSESLFKKGLCLPSGSNLSVEDKQRIKEVMINFILKAK